MDVKIGYNPSANEIIKAFPGRKFDWDRKVWSVPDEHASELLNRLNGVISHHEFRQMTELVSEIIVQQEQNIVKSKKSDSNIDIPKPDGLEYFPFQKAGIHYCLDKKGVLIADEMGLGKTIQAIGIINSDPRIKTVLCVCPASLKLNWMREMEKWLTESYRITILNGKKRVVVSSETIAPKLEITIINYDVLAKLEVKPYDMVILDEAHYIKNGKQKKNSQTGKYEFVTKRVKNAHALLKLADRKLLLTGTPVVNRPNELWSLLYALDPNRFYNFFGFAQEYCNAHNNGYGWDFSGCSNLDSLHRILRANYMVRRLKKDVLKDLPDKTRQMIILPENVDSRKENKKYQKMMDRMNSLSIQKDMAELMNDKKAYKLASASLQELEDVLFSEMSAMRHDTAVAKIPDAIKFIEELMENDRKVVVFCHHHDVIDGLYQHFGHDGSVVKIDGRMNQNDRDKSVQSFQNNPLTKLFIGGIQSAGVGLTLTAASTVVFVELDWVPGNMSQAEDRCHRIGQKDCVNIFHLVMENTLDAQLSHALISKQAIIDRALDTDIKTEKMNMSDIVYRPPKESRSWEPKEPKKKPAATFKSYTYGQRQEVLSKLQTLAGMCDGAFEKDGCGFNRIDTAFGKALAQNGTLSDKQMIIAVRIVKKYHRQVGKTNIE